MALGRPRKCRGGTPAGERARERRGGASRLIRGAPCAPLAYRSVEYTVCRRSASFYFLCHCERSEACVDGPLLARGGRGIFRACVRLRACVRPVDAASAAGARWFAQRESKQSSDLVGPLLNAVLSPVADRTIPSIFSLSSKVGLASLERSSRDADARVRRRTARWRCRLAFHASPLTISFQAMRAILLASATAASLAGFGCGSPSAQPEGLLARCPGASAGSPQSRPPRGDGAALGSPARVMRPGRALPAVEWSRGVGADGERRSRRPRLERMSVPASSSPMSEAIRRPEAGDRRKPPRNLARGMPVAQPPVERGNSHAQPFVLLGEPRRTDTPQVGDGGGGNALKQRLYRRQALGSDEAKLRRMTTDRVGDLRR